MPSARSRSTSRNSWCAARSATSRCACAAAAASGPAGRYPHPQRLSSRLGGRQRRPGPLKDQLTLLLRHRRVDPHHQVIGNRHAGRPDRDAVLQQLRQRASAARDPIQPRGDKQPSRRSSLPLATSECSATRGQPWQATKARTLACCTSSPRPLWPCSAVESRYSPTASRATALPGRSAGIGDPVHAVGALCAIAVRSDVADPLDRLDRDALARLHPGEEAADRVGLPGGCLGDLRDRRAFRPAQESEHLLLLGPFAGLARGAGCARGVGRLACERGA